MRVDCHIAFRHDLTRHATHNEVVPLYVDRMPATPRIDAIPTGTLNLRSYVDHIEHARKVDPRSPVERAVVKVDADRDNARRKPDRETARRFIQENIKPSELPDRLRAGLCALAFGRDRRSRQGNLVNTVREFTHLDLSTFELVQVIDEARRYVHERLRSRFEAYGVEWQEAWLKPLFLKDRAA